MSNLFIPLCFHFESTTNAIATGTRVLVSEGCDNGKLPGVIVGQALDIDGTDGAMPWMAVKIDGHTFDYGVGPGIEYRPIDQLELAA